MNARITEDLDWQMGVRLPWISSRIVFVVLALWDTLALYLVYNLIYLSRLGNWEGINKALLVIISSWTISSYLVGRYSIVGKRSPLESIRKVSYVSAFTLAIFVGHSWLFSVVDAETRFKGFLVPLIVESLFASLVGQFLVPLFYRNKKKWILFCSNYERKVMESELEKCSDSLAVKVLFRDISSDILKSLSFGSNSYIIGWQSENADINVEKIEKLLEVRAEGKEVVSLVSWCESKLHRIPPELISNAWLAHAEGFSLKSNGASLRIKRLGDLVGGVCLMVITCPILLVACIAVWIEDRGPVFYRQQRTGMFGKKIAIVKIRSMNVDAERYGAQWSRAKDPRVTRVGRVIRALRIDELPQLVSVLKGDLSLIGPRPEREIIEESLKKTIPHYVVRHWVRPGLSGWAQVCYPYGASVEDSRMTLSYDLYYIRNLSIFLDLLIFIKTVRLILGGKGASPKAPQ